jgi:hypothetical protein
MESLAYDRRVLRRRTGGAPAVRGAEFLTRYKVSFHGGEPSSQIKPLPKKAGTYLSTTASDDGVPADGDTCIVFRTVDAIFPPWLYGDGTMSKEHAEERERVLRRLEDMTRDGLTRARAAGLESVETYLLKAMREIDRLLADRSKV